MKTEMDSRDCSLDATIWNEMAMLVPFHMANTIYPLQTTPMSTYMKKQTSLAVIPVIIFIKKFHSK